MTEAEYLESLDANPGVRSKFMAVCRSRFAPGGNQYGAGPPDCGIPCPAERTDIALMDWVENHVHVAENHLVTSLWPSIREWLRDACGDSYRLFIAVKLERAGVLRLRDADAMAFKLRWREPLPG